MARSRILPACCHQPWFVGDIQQERPEVAVYCKGQSWVCIYPLDKGMPVLSKNVFSCPCWVSNIGNKPHNSPLVIHPAMTFMSTSVRITCHGVMKTRKSETTGHRRKESKQDFEGEF